MLSFFIKLLFGLLCISIFLGVWRTWQMENSPNQTLFLNGTSPEPRLDGFYNGSVPGHSVSWLGKKFNALLNTGINVFDDGKGGQEERYSFNISYIKGLKDKNLDVLAIDYNIPENPFWLRLILDEVVEVAQGEYLGKLHVRIVPGFPFTLAYFKLGK